jgi:hypothetical protein
MGCPEIGDFALPKVFFAVSAAGLHRLIVIAVVHCFCIASLFLSLWLHWLEIDLQKPVTNMQ